MKEKDEEETASDESRKHFSHGVTESQVCLNGTDGYDEQTEATERPPVVTAKRQQGTHQDLGRTGQCSVHVGCWLNSDHLQWKHTRIPAKCRDLQIMEIKMKNEESVNYTFDYINYVQLINYGCL